MRCMTERREDSPERERSETRGDDVSGPSSDHSWNTLIWPMPRRGWSSLGLTIGLTTDLTTGMTIGVCGRRLRLHDSASRPSILATRSPKAP